MPFPIIMGMGEDGDGTANTLLVTEGYGGLGESVIPTCKALQVIKLENFGHYLIATFNRPVTVAGPALLPISWSIEVVTPDAVDVVISAITQTEVNQVKINISEQTDGATYKLNVPYVGIVDNVGNVVQPPYSVEFLGIGVAVTVVLTRSIDARTLEVIFSEAVVPEDALTLSNYYVVPTLQILAAAKSTDSIYQLTTSRQDELQSYTITIENIRDLANNSIP